MTRPELKAQKSTPLVELPTTPAPASELPQTPTPDVVRVVTGAIPRTDLKKFEVALTARPGVAPDVTEPSTSRRPGAFAAAGRELSAVTPTAPAAPAAAIPAIRSSSRRLWRSLPLPLALPPWPFESF